jgi:hypothetical protein
MGSRVLKQAQLGHLILKWGRNMNIPLVTLAALMALIPFNASAQCDVSAGVVVADELIEGTGSADIIDCSDSTSISGYEIYGYGGDDEIIGSPNADFIAGGNGKDTIHGYLGDDSIDGGADDDFIDGGAGDDVLFGGVGSSPASGVGCSLQTVPVPTGSSYLTKGGSGDDTIFGGIGNDCINAGSGEDVVHGGEGFDTLVGGNHSDLLDGGPDRDWLDGGWHTDTCVDVDGDDWRNCELFAASPPYCGDEVCDPGEDSCICPQDCETPPANETLCADGLDNDCDGDIDCDDVTDCSIQQACQSCEPLGSLCSSDSECCSNKCKGKPGSKTCK